MHLCVKHNHLEALNLLVESMTDDKFVNSTDDDGNTILHLAAAMKHTELCMDLLINATHMDTKRPNDQLQQMLL
jgi:ankyrin repeat protein